MDWKNRLENIQNKIRLQLFSRKIDDLEGVYKIMAQFDQSGSGSLNRDEFQKFLTQIGVFLTTQELRSVYDQYDKNKDGSIAYGEFVSLIRENMSEKRIEIVRHAFRFLDKRNEGRLSLQYLISTYIAKNHPRVRTREKTAEQVMQQFQNAISKRSSDGQTIDENEFLNYYADVNATQPSEKEEYFIDVVISTWGITSGIDYVSPDRVAQLEIILFEKIRQKTLPKEDEGKTASKAFKYFDQADKKTIDIKQFSQALAKFGCVFSEKEIVALFNKYDKDHTGKLCYDEFCGLIATMGSGKTVNLNPVFQMAREPPIHTLKKLREDLIKIGQHSVRKMGKSFLKCDKNKNGILNRQEFQWAMRESGVLLTKTEYDNLYQYFDKNFDDQVSYNEFLSFIRTPLNERRMSVVTAAWKSLTNEDTVSLDILKQTYFSSKSLDQIWGRRSVADAAKDFAVQFEQAQIKFNDFISYHTDISGLVSEDQVFENFVAGVWKL